MIGTWWLFLIAYLIFYTSFTQFYKLATKRSHNDGALTVLLQCLGGIIALFFVPFFSIEFPQKLSTYLFLGIACIFYAISDRIATTVRKGLEASMYGILAQLCTVFVTAWGFLFFKEAIVLKKLIGAVLILSANVLVLYQKGKFQWNKYILFSLLGNLAMSIGVSIDVGISNQFNLAIYVAATLILPALFIMAAERIHIKDVFSELKYGGKTPMLAVAVSWPLMLISMLRAYQLGEVTTVAPLCAVTTILNVGAAYFILKEKGFLLRKIIAAVIVIAGIIFIG